MLSTTTPQSSLRSGAIATIRYDTMPMTCLSQLLERRNEEEGLSVVSVVSVLPRQRSNGDGFPRRRTRAVHFHLAITTEHSISTRWQDLTKKEKSALWYSKSEFSEIREEVDSTLKLLAAGLTDPERVGFCYRGIEYKTPELRKERTSNVVDSLELVFAAQKYLRQRKTPSDSYDTLIARKYRSCTEKCEVDAHRRGIWDAKSVNLLWRQDKSPKLPSRRKYAKAAG
jgi:hypothetical protein